MTAKKICGICNNLRTCFVDSDSYPVCFQCDQDHFDEARAKKAAEKGSILTGINTKEIYDTISHVPQSKKFTIPDKLPYVTPEGELPEDNFTDEELEKILDDIIGDKYDST